MIMTAMVWSSFSLALSCGYCVEWVSVRMSVRVFENATCAGAGAGACVCLAGALALEVREGVEARFGLDVGAGVVGEAAVPVDHDGNGLELVLPVCPVRGVCVCVCVPACMCVFVSVSE